MSSNLTEVRPERKIEGNPFDVDAWNSLIREAQKKKIDEARPFYERLIAQFPNSGRFWKSYIEHELKSRNYEVVENLFQKCLIKVLNTELWKCYLAYIRETKGHLASFREKMAQAYDFALDRLGLDLLSHQIYQDYIAFLRNVPAVGAHAENQKAVAVRKIYQRALSTPILNIEQLWNEYTAYEKSVNAVQADRILSERSKDYQAARRVAKAAEMAMRGINRNMISVPPRGTPAELKQVELWKKYIVWEKTNPLSTGDFSAFVRRVVFAYEIALLCLGYYPDVWYDAATFMQESARTLQDKGDTKACNLLLDDISNLYERAITTLLADNMLVYFQYADFEEERMKYEKVQEIYSRFFEQKNVDPTLAYIQYMKFARRTEGIKAARTVFRKAREDDRSRYHVYIAAAQMEYFCAKDAQVAQKIFELGLKRFGNSAEYCLQYIDFLRHLNEDNKTRVLFESIVSLTNEKPMKVWDSYLEFETQVGDLISVNKVDRRRRKILEPDFDNCQTVLLLDRYRFMDIYPCSPDDLLLLGYSENVVSHLSRSHSYNSQVIRQIPQSVEAAVAAPSSSNAVAEYNGKDSLPPSDPTARKKPSGYPVPDVSQMLPFKPRIIVTSSTHPVPGGVFPPPPAVSYLLTLLPPPVCFKGPFVSIDALMERFRGSILPEELIALPGAVENGALDPKMDDVKRDMYNLLSSTTDPLHYLSQQQDAAGKGRKRGWPKRDSDDEDSGQAPPSKDVYRMRQTQKHTRVR